MLFGLVIAGCAVVATYHFVNQERQIKATKRLTRTMEKRG